MSDEYLDGVERQLLRTLERMGINITEPSATLEVNAHAYATRVERYNAWIAESVLTGLRATRKGDIALAIRCYGQAREYIGDLDARREYVNVYARDCVRGVLENQINRAIERCAVEVCREM